MKMEKKCCLVLGVLLVEHVEVVWPFECLVGLDPLLKEHET